MLLKHQSIELKNIDEKEGVVEAYANVYNVKDAQGDISDPSSFQKTVKENRKRIKVLKDHDKRISLGVPLDINPEDSYGLFTVTKFNLSKTVAKDAFTDILLSHETGLNTELSVGVQAVQRDFRNKSLVKEWKLFEYSFLTAWGANELSTVTGVKSLQTLPEVLKMIETAYDLDYSDERLLQIENILKSLTTEPHERTPVIEPIDVLKEFNKKFV